MSARVQLLPQEPEEPENVLRFSDGRTVVCHHDGAPCNGCRTPREDWPAVWEPGFFRLVEEGS
ncbi:hypothetical protein AS594_07205 [Streptomyces agglomeratus]|uniref:Uncharacterized protein n=1 Tax=Streptomyces agglomeratus TaxID=285458 RepID=A0A1E5P435_9ACTN|nr:hypothetical protein AS594_07205 [Streptomyces agglomeratus]